jgi:hypothetical protein
MSLPSSESISYPDGLAEISDSLVRSLAGLSGSATDTTDVQSLLCSLSVSLRHTGKALLGLGSPSTSSDGSSGGILDALEACRGDLNDLVELQKTLVQSTSSSAQDHDEPDEGTPSATTNNRDRFIKLKQALITHMNTLTLTLSLSQRYGFTFVGI